MSGWPGESGICEHVRYSAGYDVAFGGGCEHDDAESGGHQEGDAIRVGDKILDGDGATGTQ